MYYYKLWMEYFDKAIKQWKEYSLDFIFISFASLFTIFIGVINIEIIFSEVKSIAGWNKNEVLWMYGYFNFVQCIFNTFFINCFDISSWVHSGKIDMLKVRPCSVFFQLMCSERYNTEFPIDQFIMGIVLMIRAGMSLDLKWNVIRALQLVFIMIFSVIIYSTLIFIISALSLWTVKNNYFIEFIMELENINQYPITAYGLGMSTFLTYIVPIGFVSFYPNMFFLGYGNGYTLVFAILGVTVLLLSIACVIWKLGLARYQSPNS